MKNTEEKKNEPTYMLIIYDNVEGKILVQEKCFAIVGGASMLVEGKTEHNCMAFTRGDVREAVGALCAAKSACDHVCEGVRKRHGGGLVREIQNIFRRGKR